MATQELSETGTEEAVSDTPTDPALVVDGLSKQFGSGEAAVTAVDDVSFGVERGSVVGLLGPNGAGKTTTIKSILGMVLPDAGSVRVAGIDVHERPRKAYAHVDAMLEGARNDYWRLTVRENLRYFATISGVDPDSVTGRHERLLDQLDLRAKADEPVRDLSRGMKQKVSLASVLATDASVVFLDEPTLGLDVETSLELHTELRRLAAEDDVTIVLTSHDMDVVEAVSDRVMILQDGSIIADDDVGNLIDILATQSLRITVPAPIRQPLRQRLEDGLDLVVEEDEESATIQCHGADSQTVYDLMRLLDGQDKELRGVESVDPDLEQIFLQLTDDADNDPVGADTTARATDGADSDAAPVSTGSRGE